MSSTFAWIWRYRGRGLLRAIWFAMLWWIVTRGDPTSWVVGIPAVIAATLMSVVLLPERTWRWRVLGGARFLVYFLRQSVLGGFDVAWRAFHPRLPLAPGLYMYTLRLPSGPAQTLLANTVSLLPGTLSATLQEDRLTVHTLDTSQPLLAQLQHLEEVVALLFGVQLSSDTLQRT